MTKNISKNRKFSGENRTIFEKKSENVRKKIGFFFEKKSNFENFQISKFCFFLKQFEIFFEKNIFENFFRHEKILFFFQIFFSDKVWSSTSISTPLGVLKPKQTDRKQKLSLSEEKVTLFSSYMPLRSPIRAQLLKPSVQAKIF